MPSDDLTRLAQWMVEIRSLRRRLFPPEMFGGEAAWDLLLHLFLADAHGRRLTGRTLLAQAGANPGSGARWIAYLNSVDLVVGDGKGDLDDNLALTPRGLDAMERWLHETRVELAS